MELTWILLLFWGIPDSIYFRRTILFKTCLRQSGVDRWFPIIVPMQAPYTTTYYLWFLPPVSVRVFTFLLSGLFCCLGLSGVSFCCLGGWRAHVFAVWAGACFFFAAWAVWAGDRSSLTYRSAWLFFKRPSNKKDQTAKKKKKGSPPVHLKHQ